MPRFSISHFALPGALLLALGSGSVARAQKAEPVRVTKDAKAKKFDVYVGKQLFTSFLYPAPGEAERYFLVIFHARLSRLSIFSQDA